MCKFSSSLFIMLQFYKFSSLFIEFEREDDKSDTQMKWCYYSFKKLFTSSDLENGRCVTVEWSRCFCFVLFLREIEKLVAMENKGTSILNFFSAQYPSFKPSLYYYIIVNTETINLVLLTIYLLIFELSSKK